MRGSGSLPETAAALNDLDLVAVRIRYEEEPGENFALPLHVDHRAGSEASAFESGVLGGQVFDRQREMTITVAEGVGVRSSLVDRQFEFERRRGIRKID